MKHLFFTLILILFCFITIAKKASVNNDFNHKTESDNFIRGSFRNQDGKVELIQYRTANSRVMEDYHGVRTTVISTRPIHYFNKNKSVWEEIDYNLVNLDEKSSLLIMPHHNPKFELNLNDYSLNIHKESKSFTIHYEKSAIAYDENLEVILKNDFSKSPNTEKNNNKITAFDIFENTDLEQVFYPEFFKTNYIINSPAKYDSIVKWIAFKQVIEVPLGWTLQPISYGSNSGDIISDGLVLISEQKEEMAIFPRPAYSDSWYDHAKTTVGLNNITRPAFIDYQKDRSQGSAEGFYKLNKKSENEYIVEIMVPTSWLNCDNRVYPVNIDPVTIYETDYILQSCFYPDFESNTFVFYIPEGDTILFSNFEWEYTAVAGSGAWISDQVSYISGINGQTNEFTGSLDEEGVHTYSTFSNILNTVSDGMNEVVFHASRIWGPNYEGGECNATYNFISNRRIEITHVEEILYDEGTVVINEYCASNRFMLDDFDNYEDWVEIYNPNPFFVNLEGYYLSDDPENPLRWEFPTVHIAPYSHLLVICSGRDDLVGGIPHTNFRLTQLRPESIVLSDPDGNILESYELWTTQNGHSVGRVVCGGEEWGITTNPTPGMPNAGHMLGYTGTPMFSIDGGFYNDQVAVSLSTTDYDSEIRYTVDGSEPSIESMLYTEPIEITETTVVRARVFANNPNILPGFIETNTYFIDEFHTLPVFSFSGEELPTLFGGLQIEPLGAVEFFDKTGQFIDKSYCEFDKHGNDSWNYPQRGVDFVSRDEYGYSRRLEHEFFQTTDRDRFQRLMVKAAANDNYPFEEGGAHIRDSYIQHLSQFIHLDLDERTTTNCIVYVNGEYWGVYDLREKVDDKDFTRIHYDQPRQYKGSELYIQFIKTWGPTSPKYGEQAAINDWNDLRSFVQNNDMSEEENYNYLYETLNIMSFIDHMVANSFIVSRDWLNYNTGWWRGLHPDGSAKKWRYIMWDMEAALGHYINWTDIPDVNYTALPCNVENLNVGYGHTQILSKLIEESEGFRQKYINRYADLQNTHFSYENLEYVLDSMIAVITPEMPRQIERWGGSMEEWQQNVQDLKDWIYNRCELFTDLMIECYDLEGPYPFTISVYPSGSGKVKMNTEWLPSYPFNANIYGNIETQFIAHANSSYEFSHWEISNHEVLPDSLSPDIILNAIENETLVAHFIDANLDDKELLYYWHFNELDADDNDVTSIDADYNYWAYADAKMIYTGSGARDIDEYEPGTHINALIGSPPGKAARVRNPSENRSLVFNMPTNNFGELIFEYAVHRSSNGMLNNIISYSVDGENFIQTNLESTTFQVTEDYQLIAIDFSHIEEVNNNPLFHVKIEFDGNTNQSNGNNRFDNISLKGIEMDITKLDDKIADKVEIYPNPFRNRIFIESEFDFTRINIFSVSGKLLKSKKSNYSKYKEICLKDLPTGVYIIVISGSEHEIPLKIIKR